jgi:Sulfotransferase domain
MLALSRGVGYIEEPFSLRHRRGVLDVDFPFWFQYICPENESPFVEPVQHMLAFRYRLGAELKTLRSPKDAARLARDWSRFRRYRRRGARPLLKDPIAVLSAEWLADRFAAAVVMTIRHPAGFVSSLLRLGWTHPFDHFIRQPLLMRDLLKPFEEQIRAFAADPPPLLDQGILLWNVIHHVIRGYRDRHPNWTFVRHEDLATQPIEGFRELYGELGLPFDQPAQAAIDRHSTRSAPQDRISPFDVRRNSKATVSSWRARLTDGDIERVRTGVEPIARDFYSDADWEGVLRPERSSSDEPNRSK